MNYLNRSIGKRSRKCHNKCVFHLKGKGDYMKKYVVICYSVHNKEIASHDTFDNEDDAYAFLEKDAQNTYEEEMNNASEEDKDSIDFTISDDGTADLSSYDGEYEWTWEVIEV